MSIDSESKEIDRKFEELNNKMCNTLKEFNEAMDSFATTLAPEALILFHKKIVLEALTRIVLKTPVRTGRARGNWQTTVGSPATGEIAQVESSGGADDSVTIQQGLKVLSTLPPNSIVWISNNVEYIVYLEMGHSEQAPAGMVALSIEELKGMFND